MSYRNYFAKTAPEKFGFIKSDVMSRFSTEFPEWITLACGLHFLVNNGADYFRSGSYIPSPDEMLDRLEGDCEDQSVLLASMYIASGLEPRFLAILDCHGGGAHLLTEVYCPVPDTATMCSVTEKFYRRELDMDIGAISWESTGRRGHWIVADPGFSRYIGDIEALKRDGYITETQDGWEWCNRDAVQTL